MPEVIVVGAGPAGLMAATYLGRFHRPPMVVDGGDSRAQWIPTSRNIPGFPQGIGGRELLGRLRTQATQYGADIVAGEVSEISRESDGFTVTLGKRLLKCRFVILASGVKDRFPDINGVEAAVLRSVLRVCPICDGFEASGKRVAVIGDGSLGERESQFLAETYTKDVTFLHLGHCDPSIRARLEALGVAVKNVRLDQLRAEADALWLDESDGAVRYDVCYSAMGCASQNRLAIDLGAARDESDALTVSKHQQTSADGLYAAGDVVRGLNQIAVAASEAAIAATDIHNRLRRSTNSIGKGGRLTASP